jgi:hypothetical protein
MAVALLDGWNKCLDESLDVYNLCEVYDMRSRLYFEITLCYSATMTSRLDILPLEILRHIHIFLLDKNPAFRSCRLRRKHDLWWCPCCGEQTETRWICRGHLCRDCCLIHCINRGHFYRNLALAPPLNVNEVAHAFLHEHTHSI